MRTIAAVIRNVGPSLHGLLSLASPGQHSSSSRQYAASELLNHLWATLPDEREALRAYVDRAKSYRNECGCTMGGVFFLVTLALLILYGFVYHRFTVEQWFLEAVLATVCLFSATLVGKLMGIGLARIRLLFLVRELRRRFSLEGT